MVSSTDCKSAVYDCDGSTPSLPTNNLIKGKNAKGISLHYYGNMDGYWLYA